jgi:transmembrane sensor
MNKHLTQSVSPQARNEAAEWFVLFKEGEADATAREAFHGWLRKSPENVHAYLRMAGLWEDTGLLAKSNELDRQALLQRALKSANVVEFEPIARRPSSGIAVSRAGSSRLRVAIAASILIATAAVLGWMWVLKDTYSTGVGEQRTVSLQDGSALIINSGSRVRVRFSEHERDIDLLSGQALFRVAHDTSRPFVVHSGSTRVRAVGTQFDVYQKATGTVITVLEGTVAVREDDGQNGAAPAPGSKKDGQILLQAGFQLTVTPQAMRSTTPANLEAATAWTQGKLIFDETPLSEVVAEFNRYSARRLVIEDPALQRFHVSGIFPSSDPGRIAALLRQRFGIEVRESEDEIRIVRH